MTRRSPWLVLVLVLVPGCRYSFMVESNPPGAEVFVDGVARGKTPLTIRERPGWMRTAVFSVRKPGFRPRHEVVTESEIYDPTAAAVGVWYTVAPIVVWATCGAPGLSCFKPYYYFELEPAPPLRPRATSPSSWPFVSRRMPCNPRENRPIARMP